MLRCVALQTPRNTWPDAAKWAGRITIEKKVKWIGKPKEEKRERETNRKSIEDKIAE